MEQVGKNWGYTILTPTSLQFYHKLLPKIGIKFLATNLQHFQEIEVLTSESILIHTKDPYSLSLLIQILEDFLSEMDSVSTTTPNFTYRIKDVHRKFLKEYFLSFEAMLGLILSRNLTTFSFDFKDLELINSQIGGIYVHPYTLLFYEDHLKVIHPISQTNYFIREEIEQMAAVSIRGMLRRVENAAPGFEGVAILSYVEGKTGFSSDYISRITNEKTRSVRNPSFSPLLQK